VLAQGVACGGSLVIRHVQIMPRMLPFDRPSRKTHSFSRDGRVSLFGEGSVTGLRSSSGRGVDGPTPAGSARAVCCSYSLAFSWADKTLERSRPGRPLSGNQGVATS
jgi:hypothetical protein